MAIQDPNSAPKPATAQPNGQIPLAAQVPKPAPAPQTAPVPTPVPVAPAPTAPNPNIPLAPVAPAPVPQPLQGAPVAGPAPLPLAPTSPPSLGPRPTANASNWQTADAQGAAWDQANEAASIAAGKADDANGYNYGETQEQLNARRGLTVNPATGAWDNPGQRVDSTAANAASNQAAVDDTSKWFQEQGGSAIGANGQPIPGTQTNPSGVIQDAGYTPLPMAPPSDIPGAAPWATGTGAPAGTPGSGIAAAGPPGGAPLPMASGPTTGPGGVSLSGQDLTGSTIAPGQGADRLKLATDAYDTFAKQDAPRFDADVLRATQNRAAMGGIASGGLRTDVGNLVAGRDLRLQGERERLTNNATEGSIGDQRFATGVAQQQQNRQDDTQRTAFDQGAREIALNEALTSGDFNRYMQLLNAGESGNPSNAALQLAGNYGEQAGQAGQAATGLIQNSVANNSSQIPPWLMQYLQQQGQQPQGQQLPRATGGNESIYDSMQ